MPNTCRIVLACTIAVMITAAALVGSPSTKKSEDDPIARKLVVKKKVEMLLTMQRSAKAGEPMILAASLRNVGQEPVGYGPVDAGYKDFRILVKAEGKLVPLTRFGKRSGVTTIPTEFRLFTPLLLKPGTEAVIYVNLGLLYDLTLPGKYEISAATTMYPPGAPKNSSEFVVEVTGLKFEVKEPRRLRERPGEKGGGEEDKARRLTQPT